MKSESEHLTAEQHKKIADDLDLECEELFNKKKLKLALYHCNESLRLKREYPDAYYRRSVINLKLEYFNDQYRDIKRAIKLYKEELKLDNSSFDLNFKLGLSYYINYRDSNYIEEAIYYFKKALKIKKDSETYCYLGDIYQWQLQSYDTSLDYYNKAIEIHKGNPKYYFGRALCYDWLHLYEDALLNYNKAIELDPLEEQYYSARGELYITLKQWEKAEEDYKKVRAVSMFGYEPKLELIKGTCGGLYFDFYLVNEKESGAECNDILEYPYFKLHESVFYVYYTCFSDIKSFDHYGCNDYNRSQLKSLLYSLKNRLILLSKIKNFEEFFNFAEREFFLEQLIREFEVYRDRWKSILGSLIKINNQLIKLVEEALCSCKILYVLGI